jgi:two-component sensor histidine kinase
MKRFGRLFGILRAPFLATVFLIVAAIAVILVLASSNAVDVERITNESYQDYRENVIDQSASLSRLIFAVHRVVAFSPAPGESPEAVSDRRRRVCEAVLSHAGFVKTPDPVFLSRMLGDDPLLLLPRLAASDHEYEARLSAFRSILAAVASAGNAEARKALLDAFASSSGAFMDVLAERSALFLQLEDYFFVVSKKQLAHSLEHTRDIILLIAVLFACLSAAVGLYLRNLLRTKAELALHRNHLADLVERRTAELSDANGRLIAEIAERQSIEERLRAAVSEKEDLLKEVYHRVKNNLTMVNSLIYLQRMECAPEAKPIFEDLENRIQVFSLIHEKLYKSADLANLELSEYLGDIARSLVRSLRDDPDSIRVEVEADSFRLSPDVLIPLGLIVTEVVTNSVKHGFRGRGSGLIRLRAARSAEGLELNLSDDGAPPAEVATILQSRSLGALLVQNFCLQLGGSMEVSLDGGTNYRFVFPQLRG